MQAYHLKKLLSRFNLMYHDYTNATIQHNVKLLGRDGYRQFDVVIAVKVPDDELITVIEGKDYNRKVSIEKIDAFHSKMSDVNASKGIFISKKGFSSGAISKAKRLGIVLYSLTSQLDFKNDSIKLNILLKEVSPFAINVRYAVETNELKNLPGRVYFDPDNFFINDLNVNDTVSEYWEKDLFEYVETESEQNILIPLFSGDCRLRYYFNQLNNSFDSFKINDVKLSLTLKIRYFELDLKDYLHSAVLNNIHKNQLKFFVDKISILNAIDNLTPVSNSYGRNFTGIKSLIKVKGKMSIAFESMDVKPNK